MGKPKGSAKSNHHSKVAKVSDDEDYADTVDPSASDFIYDAVDEYHENEEREGAEKLAKLMKRTKKTVQKDILGVATSSDEDETPKQSKKKKRTKKSHYSDEPLPPLDSELDEEKDGDDEEINMEWGKKRSAYYNADYVDEEWDDGNESDVEVAELEEQEALAIQQRMAQQLEEADFGLDFITHLKAADKVKGQSSVEEEKIDVNLSKLSKREKVKLLTEESPELLELVDDFKYQMTELRNNLEPVLKLVTEKVLPPSPGVDYIKAKYQLILNYCTQIGYYFVLKSKRISVQNHPVVKRLVQFRSLLHQLETAGKSLQPEIDNLLSKIEEKETITREEFVRTIVPPRKKLRILSSKQQTEIPKETNDKKDKNLGVKKKENKSASLTRDEENALDFYKAVRGPKKVSEEATSSDDGTSQNLETAVDNNPPEEEEELGKRGINYQIAKNKGLTPHRSKEQRNPRVKNRMKFRKAKIRRKGAIREPRKELQKYGGEISGIKATVVRSVKLK